MSKLVIAVEKRSSIQWIGEIYCLVLLLLPNAVIQATSIYTRTTPATIWYKYTSFYFSALIIPAIFWALLIRKRTNALRFDFVIVAIILKDLLMLLIPTFKQFVDYNFSFNLILISGWSIVSIVFSFAKQDDTDSVERFLDVYFILAVLSQLLRLTLRLSTDGRYGAIGLSVGGTGYFDGVFLIYCLYHREFTNRVVAYMIFAFISLVLSGQRSNILFVLIFCIPYILNRLTGKVSKIEGRRFLLIWYAAGLGVLLISTILILDDLGIKIRGIQFITRTIDAFELLMEGDISTEFSVKGRLLSLAAGFDILKNNIFGITNNFYELQYRMLQHAYPTFPHNTLLCCYLLWSPFITFFCFIYLTKTVVSAFRVRSGMLWPILYIYLYNIITGSVFLDYPYFVVNLYFISLAKCKIEQNFSEGQLQDEFEE